MQNEMTVAIAKLNAVPVAPVWRWRLKISHVYQALECGGRWYGADEIALAKLGEALLSGREDAYSHWCAETATVEVPFLVYDRDGGNEETFRVATMADAMQASMQWAGDSACRIGIIAPDGEELFGDVMGE